MSLILTEIPSFALFPGQVSPLLRSHSQIVGVEGVMSNRRIQVAKLYPVGDPLQSDAQGFPVVVPPCSSQTDEAVQIVVARGPFTSRDDGEYEQLRELLRVCGENKPSLLVLVRSPSPRDV